jgi:hypothetical protein
LVVAAASEAGCNVLFTEELQHGRKFGGVTVQNSFLRRRKGDKDFWRGLSDDPKSHLRIVDSIHHRRHANFSL